jgi:hypothetical protein
MITVLSSELATYVRELHAVADGPSQPQLYSTVASGGSCDSVEEALARMEAKAETIRSRHVFVY